MSKAQDSDASDASAAERPDEDALVGSTAARAGDDGDAVAAESPEQAVETESPATVDVTVVCGTDVGLVRERNEDTPLVCALSDGAQSTLAGEYKHDVTQDALLLAIFDGMGGAASGHVASKLGAEVMARELSEAQPALALAWPDRLEQAVLRTDRAIAAAARDDWTCHGMGTTVTAALIRDERALLAHVGDTRAYMLRDGKLVQLTEDQSLSQELAARGELPDDAAERMEVGNVILQALGVSHDIVPFIGEVALRRDDLLLLCSDGLTDLVDDAQIAAELVEHRDDLSAASRSLIQRACDAGGHDNVTVLLASVAGAGLRPSDEEPVKVSALRFESTRALLRRQSGRGGAWAALAVLLVMVFAALVILFQGRG